MKKLRNIFITALSAICAFCFAACGDKPGPKPEKDVYREVSYTAEHSSSDRLVSFYSSDESLSEFLNDYRERHMRYNDNRIHTHPVGAGQSAWKEWEAMIGSWWDASATYGTLPEHYATRDWVTNWLLSPPQDRQGYIWADDGVTYDSWGMGWAFPSVNVLVGGAVTYPGNYYKFDTPGDFEGFTATGGGMSVANSVLQVTANNVEQIEIISKDALGFSTIISPFLKFGMFFDGNGGYELEDIYIYYTTENEPTWNEENKVSFSRYALNGHAVSSDAPLENAGYFIPMYMSDGWGFSRTRYVKQFKIVLRAKQGTTFSGTFGLDYAITEYDDRQALNPCNYILAAKSVCEYAQDASLVKRILPNARKAMNFLYNQLDGESGLISTAYFKGHNSDGGKRTGTGLGNGYWDVLAFPDVNLYCNLSYYNAVCAMYYLETMAQNMDISASKTTTVNSEMDGFDEYSLDADSLAALTVKSRDRFRAEFWNDKTKRFHAGKFEDGTVLDCGYLMFNEQAVAAGLPDSEQTKLIMQWINGERKVESDNSTGSDIYYYEFAPRFNTADIGSNVVWSYESRWDGNVQNGGTALHLGYYDIVAQSRYSAEKTYGRLYDVRDWYGRVTEAWENAKKEDPSLSPMRFYRPYYQTKPYNPQGGDSGGVVGLDYEFLEAALLIKAVPDALFGMDTLADGTLVFEPVTDKGLDWLRMENVTFAGYYVDATVSRYFVEISGVTRISDKTGNKNAKLQVRLLKPTFDCKVLVGGKEAEYKTEGDRLVVDCPLDNVRVEIVPAAR